MKEIRTSLICLESDLKFAFFDLINRESKYLGMPRKDLMKFYNDYFAPRLNKAVREFNEELDSKKN